MLNIGLLIMDDHGISILPVSKESNPLKMIIHWIEWIIWKKALLSIGYITIWLCCMDLQSRNTTFSNFRSPSDMPHVEHAVVNYSIHIQDFCFKVDTGWCPKVTICFNEPLSLSVFI